jgi:TetR/AcrR family transcriptional repressor of nem operon
MNSTDLSAEKSGRDFIIWKAYQVFREQGYYQTTMADIGQACQMLKGSLYHHFSSKEDLMQQVLLVAHEKFRGEALELAYHEQTPPGQRLEQMLAVLDQFYFDRQGGCLMALVGMETATRQPAFIQTIKQFFSEWIAAFAHLLGTQYPPAEAREMAQRLVQEIEGAVVMSCIFMDKQYFTTTRNRLSQLLK